MQLWTSPFLSCSLSLPTSEMKDLEDHFLSLVLALTTWCDGLRRCLRAGRSHHHSNRGTGPWAHSLPCHPGTALGDRSSPPGRSHCIPHQGKRGSGRSCCRGSRTAGTPGPVGSSALGEGGRGERPQWKQDDEERGSRTWGTNPRSCEPRVISIRSLLFFPTMSRVYFYSHKCLL